MAAISGNESKNGLRQYLSPAGALAFSLGTSIGWGSLVVTSNAYLRQAGPAGSVLGMVIGAVVMLIIGRNYHYMMNCYPDAGGVYAFTKETFGYDYGFLTAWFLALTYLAIFWANATSLPLFVRYFFGDVFRFGFHYTILGYEVWLGEILLSSAAILLFALFCTGRKKVTAGVMTVLVGLFSVGIAVCFIAAIAKHGGSGYSFAPSFIPESSVFSQVFRVACISPWAFIGFENISHFTEEFKFPHNRAFRVLTASVIVTTLLYIFVTVLSVTAYPPEYGSWQAYISDLGNLSGIKGLPAFYAAYHYLGNAGVVILMLSLLALVFTSLIGNTIALSRLFYALAKDMILPGKIAHLNKRNVPSRAILMVALISVLIPVVGRTAIGWIVDVTTLGATIVYGFVSASAFQRARVCEDRREMRTGLAGLVLMVVVILYLLLPNLFSTGSMADESYILFTVWSILGFVFFRRTLKRDKTRRFGKSIIVWIALLSLVLFTSLVWMNQTSVTSANRAMTAIHDYYTGEEENGEVRRIGDELMEKEIRGLRRSNGWSMIVVVGLFAVALVTMMRNYSLMQKRAERSEEELGNVRRITNTDPLTGVKSKHAYVETEAVLDEKITEGGAPDFAIVVCDVNGLKHINDTLGHKAGDAYICSASVMICDLFKHSPVFRIGGDEFVVILTGKDFESRDMIMEELHKRSAENIGSGEVVVSGGISVFDPAGDKSMHDVFDRADALMYQKKQELKAMGAKSR